MKTQELLNISPQQGLPVKELIEETIEYSTSSSDEKLMSDHSYRFEHVIEGSGIFLFDSEQIPIKEGETVIIKKKTPYACRSNNNKTLKTLRISVSCGYIETMIEAYSISSGKYKLDCEQNFNNLSEIGKTEQDPTTVFFAINNLHEIIVKAAADVYKKSFSLSYILKSAVEKYIYSEFSLHNLADELNLTQITLLRKFKAAFNDTPYQYLLSKRLEYAKTLLLTSKLPVKTIAYMFTFSDENYFNYYFKKKVGLSPTEYRKKYSNLN